MQPASRRRGRAVYRWATSAVVLVAGLLYLLVPGVGNLDIEAPRLQPAADAAVVDGGDVALMSKRPERMGLELNRGFQMAMANNSLEYDEGYGRWDASCECKRECLEKGRAAGRKLGPIADWAPQALDDLTRQMFGPWRRTNITRDHHVSMVACSYRTRTHYNPTGVWMHISGNNATSLRVMIDGYMRQRRIEKYIKHLVRNAKEPLPPMAIYISTTDTPCNPHLPYLTFFMKRGVKGITIPDDSFVGGMQKDWTAAADELRVASAKVPFASRSKIAFFRGSPTHVLRSKVQAALEACCANRSDVKLAVMEKFKHLIVPLVNHTAYRYLLAIRGRTASSRDKYLNALNSTILWAAEDDGGDEQPWFQFYHALWKPWVNYVPLRPGNAQCTLDLLDDNADFAEEIAARGAEVGQFLTQEVVDKQMLKTLRMYASLQTYTVPTDPIEFVRDMYYFVKRRYKTAQVMPDDRNPVKFVFSSWLKRRVRQLQSCLVNDTRTFSYHNQTGCWYR